MRACKCVNWKLLIKDFKTVSSSSLQPELSSDGASTVTESILGAGVLFSEDEVMVRSYISRFGCSEGWGLWPEGQAGARA